jgi:hypothetical protein
MTVSSSAPLPFSIHPSLGRGSNSTRDVVSVSVSPRPRTRYPTNVGKYQNKNVLFSAPRLYLGLKLDSVSALVTGLNVSVSVSPRPQTPTSRSRRQPGPITQSIWIACGNLLLTLQRGVDDGTRRSTQSGHHNPTPDIHIPKPTAPLHHHHKDDSFHSFRL